MKFYHKTEKENFYWKIVFLDFPVTFPVTLSKNQNVIANYEEELQKWIDKRMSYMRSNPDSFRNIEISYGKRFVYEELVEDFEEEEKCFDVELAHDLIKVMKEIDCNYLSEEDGKWYIE